MFQNISPQSHGSAVPSLSLSIGSSQDSTSSAPTQGVPMPVANQRPRTLWSRLVAACTSSSISSTTSSSTNNQTDRRVGQSGQTEREGLPGKTHRSEAQTRTSLLHQAKKEPSKKITDENFLRACEDKKLKKVKNWLKEGGEIKSIKASPSPLHLASDVTRGSPDEAAAIVELLLIYGAEVNVIDVYGKAPLHYAAQSGATSVAKFLLGYGAGVNAADAYGKTPLHYAAEFDSEEVVQLLINSGADVNKADGNGQNAMHLASISGGSSSIMKGLILAGSRDFKDKNGKFAWVYQKERMEWNKILGESRSRAQVDRCRRNACSMGKPHMASQFQYFKYKY